MFALTAFSTLGSGPAVGIKCKRLDILQHTKSWSH